MGTRENQQKYRERNRDKINKASKEWAKANPKRYTFGGGYNSLHDAKKACDSLNAPPPTITSRRVYPP